jgi:hypothetical protein
MLEKVVRARFSHGAAPAHCDHGLQIPTTKCMHPVALKSPNCTEGRQAGCAWRGAVVGNFLHVSTVYFFAVGNHSTAHNNVERSR